MLSALLLTGLVALLLLVRVVRAALLAGLAALLALLVLRIRRAIDKERQENTVQERLSDTVIRRRAKDGSMLRPPAKPSSLNS